MKKYKAIIAFLLALLAFASCHKDKEFGSEKPEVGEVVVTPALNQADFTWKVVYPGKFQTGVEISDNEALENSRTVEGTKDGEVYKASIDQLEASTKYYYRIVVWNKMSRQEGEVKSFTTAMPYIVAVSANPEEGGTVTGGGEFIADSTCVVTATANEGYAFVNWTENNVQVSGEAEYTFTVTGNRNLVANFTSQAYIIQVEVDPEDGGIVEGAGGYNYNDECTLTATPNDGYVFVNWTKGNTEISTEFSITFNVTESATYVAHFQIQSYTIEVSANPEEGGTVSGGGIYSYGDLCVVTATVNEGYQFVNWTENGGQVYGEAEYSFTVTCNRQLVANFTSQAYLIQARIEPEEGGIVEGAGGYDYGQECTLKATPNEGYDFLNWTKEDGTEVSTDATYRFTVTESATYVAHFQIQSYTITVSSEPEEGGTVTGGGTFNYGENCTLTATANTGYDFDYWTKNGTTISGGATLQITVTANATYVAHFTLQTYTVMTQSNPSDGGTVSGGGNYTYGQNCILTATANTGFDFDHWTKDGTTISGGATINFTVTANATYVAYFTQQTYTITTQSNPSNGGTVSGGGNYTYGQNCTLTATANTGYVFDHWTKNGSTISGGATINFTVTANAIYVAHFTQQSYTITTQSNPSNGGTVSGGGNYTYGQSCTVVATTNSGYTFLRWTENGNEVSTNASYTFNVNTNRILVANFEQTYPVGAIYGLFTINANGDQVYFSQGNLQYQASTNTWRFASNQWNYVGGVYNGQNYGNVYENGIKCDNSQASQNYNGWIDLFGWGTSGYHDPNDTLNLHYQPWSTSTLAYNETYNRYGYGPSTNMPDHDLTGNSANYDWGVYNPISNGGNQSGIWRTLTSDEWSYVFNTRSASTVNGVMNARYAKACVNNVNGIILFPDVYIHPSGVEYPTNINSPNNSNWGENNYNTMDFALMQTAGAIFLPSAGFRGGSSYNNYSNYGEYWSASYYTYRVSYDVNFLNNIVSPRQTAERYEGDAVRLVCPAQ